jgi:hypothetical protein
MEWIYPLYSQGQVGGRVHSEDWNCCGMSVVESKGIPRLSPRRRRPIFLSPCGNFAISHIARVSRSALEKNKT